MSNLINKLNNTAMCSQTHADIKTIKYWTFSFNNALEHYFLGGSSKGKDWPV